MGFRLRISNLKINKCLSHCLSVHHWATHICSWYPSWNTVCLSFNRQNKGTDWLWHYYYLVVTTRTLESWHTGIESSLLNTTNHYTVRSIPLWLIAKQHSVDCFIPQSIEGKVTSCKTLIFEEISFSASHVPLNRIKYLYKLTTQENYSRGNLLVNERSQSEVKFVGCGICK